MEFGENLKRAREEKGITQQTLAEQLYVTRQAVSRWENGSRYPDLLTTKCIANILGVSIDSLVSNDEVKEFAEKQSIVQNTKWEKPILVLYSIICAFSLVILISKLASSAILLTSGQINVFDGGFIFAVAFPLLMNLAVGITSLLALIKTANQSISPKAAGVIGMIFYGVLGIQDIFNSIINIEHLEGVALNIAVFALSFVFMVIIGLYFVWDKKSLSILLKVGCIISVVLFAISPIYQFHTMATNGYLGQINSFSYVIVGISNVIIPATLLIQAVALDRKRKIING